MEGINSERQKNLTPSGNSIVTSQQPVPLPASCLCPQAAFYPAGSNTLPPRRFWQHGAEGGGRGGGQGKPQNGTPEQHGRSINRSKSMQRHSSHLTGLLPRGALNYLTFKVTSPSFLHSRTLICATSRKQKPMHLSQGLKFWRWSEK